MASLLASFGHSECQLRVIGDIVKHLLMPALVPELRYQGTAHARRFCSNSKPFRGRLQSDSKSKTTEDVEHHIHMFDGEVAALSAQPRLLCQNPEVETKPVPSQDCVTTLNLCGQVFYQTSDFTFRHAACGTPPASATKPEPRHV